MDWLTVANFTISGALFGFLLYRNRFLSVKILVLEKSIKVLKEWQERDHNFIEGIKERRRKRFARQKEGYNGRG